MPEARSAICLVIDRLSSAYVGALGNTWIHTPAIDALAAESMVFDRAMLDSPVLDSAYGSFWTGIPAWRTLSGRRAEGEASLAYQCRGSGMPTWLLTDEEAVAEHALAAAFDEVVRLPTVDERKQAADWQGTRLAAFFASAVELLEARRPPALVWLHTGALCHVWDSPQASRDHYASEDDPPAPPLVVPPSMVLGDDTDPDLLLGLRHSYAGEITVLDRCLELLLSTIVGSAWRDALLSVTSARGYPLGEHGVVGAVGEALYGELVHVPWLLRTPGGPRYGARSQALVQSADLCATLRDWLSLERSSDQSHVSRAFAGRSVLGFDRDVGTLRELAIARLPSGELALATPAWFARVSACSKAASAEQRPADRCEPSVERRLELFAKPDDYFEVNEVSDRCREIVEEIQQVAQAIESAIERDAVPVLTLSEALVHGMESRPVG